MPLEMWISVIIGPLLVTGMGVYMRFKLAQANKASEDRKKERDAQITEDKKRREEKDRENDRAHAELRKYIERIDASLLELRLQMIQEYQTRENSKEMEARLVRAVERIEAKLDEMKENRNVRH